MRPERGNPGAVMRRRGFLKLLLLTVSSFTALVWFAVVLERL